MPLAGPSPSCCAVLVQIEHCDQPVTVRVSKQRVVARHLIILFLMIAKFGAKLRKSRQGYYNCTGKVAI